MKNSTVNNVTFTKNNIYIKNDPADGGGFISIHLQNEHMPQSYIDDICEHIRDNFGVSIYSANFSEILILVPPQGCGFSLKKLREFVKSFTDKIGDSVSVRSFELFKYNDRYVRVYNDDSNEVEYFPPKF